MPNFSFHARPIFAAAAIAAASISVPVPVQANDLLVAPTRIVLNGSRGTEVILNNIGTEEATYRISLELRRMTPDGNLEEVETPNEIEAAAVEMIRYAPRRVVLPPNQPQAIRIGVRAPDALPDGEYRAHMLFRAIPRPQPITADEEQPTEGFNIRLTPIYGVTIPIIVRHGELAATAAISDARIVQDNDRRAISFSLSRQGEQSTYGEVIITKPGVDIPIVRARGIAVYPELTQRTVILPVNEAYEGALTGPVLIQYREIESDGGRLLAEARTELR